LLFGTLRDEENSIKKTGLTIILNLLNKAVDENNQDLVETQFLKHKQALLNIVLPTAKDLQHGNKQQIDVSTTIKCLQVISKIINMKPTIFTSD
jgi:hypothetical protein